MKTMIYMLVVALGLMLSNPVVAQESSDNKDCEVKIETISDMYKGECKNGLAHGEGVAKGADTYIGEFKNGLPSGKGKYIWANGDVYEGMFKNGEMHGKGKYTHVVDNQKKVLAGHWRNNKYMENYFNGDDYNIISRHNLEHVSIYKAGHGNQISVVLKRGNVIDPVDRLSASYASSFNQTLSLLGTSGSAVHHSTFGLGYESVRFPFNGTVRFSTTNPLGMGTRLCKLDFEILKEGSWIVEINY